MYYIFLYLILAVDNEEGAHGGFYMRVENGSRPHNGSICPNGISTQVTLTCDSSASWSNQDISSYMKVAYHHENEPCSVSCAKI